MNALAFVEAVVTVWMDYWPWFLLAGLCISWWAFVWSYCRHR